MQRRLPNTSQMLLSDIVIETPRITVRAKEDVERITPHEKWTVGKGLSTARNGEISES